MSSQFAASVLHLIDRSERLLGQFQRHHDEGLSVHRLLHSFADIYRNVSDNEDDRRGGDRIGIFAFSSAQLYIEPCIGLLKDLKATLKTPDQARSTNTLRELTNYANAMSLTLHLGATDDDRPSVEEINQLRDQLKRSCEWLRNEELLKVDLSLASDRNQSSTFMVKEGPDKMTDDSSPMALKVVCPRARLPATNTTKKKSLKLNFICHCRDADHGNSLMYEAIDTWAIPVMTISSSNDSHWSMYLYKSGKAVKVHLTDVLPEHFSQLEMLSYRWARLLSRLSGIDHHNDILRKYEAFTSVLRVNAPIAVPRSGVVEVTLVGPRTAGHSRVTKLTWVPEHLHLYHYVAAPNNLLTNIADNSDITVLLDEDCFFIWLCRPELRLRPADYKGAELFRIKVDRDTVVENRRRSVAVLDVDCTHGAQTMSSQRCSEVEFGFSKDSEATIFFDEIAAMQRRLLMRSLRTPFYGENVVYRDVFYSFSSTTDSPPLVHAVIVYNPSASRAKYRVICTYNSGKDTICYELEHLYPRNEIEELSIDKPPSGFVWAVNFSESGTIMKKMTWKEFVKDSTNEARITGRIHDSRSGPQVARESEISPEGWFEDIELINLALRQSKRQASGDMEYRRVKIAVIDTGFKCDPEDRVREQIAGYKDFTRALKAHDSKGIADKAGLGLTDDSLDTMEDKKGHGTDSVQLILKVYKDAQLYIARIFEDNRVEGNMEQYLMADAINWAVKHKVDIISISAGFQNHLNELWTAVRAASAADILIFASAANWSFTAGAAVPARLPHVFGIFATDAGCKNVREYNPPALERYPSFAFLGKDVIVTPGQKPISGTSVSTAVAAGFVARIIDFSRQSNCRAALDDLPFPGDELGMSKILQALTVKDGEYDCIVPLKIFGPGSVSSEPDKTAVNRARVIEFLRRVLGELM